jgi:hypothetical protein
MSEQTGQYEKFKIQIETILKTESAGLTWTEIKSRLNLPQKVPNNKWVHMMETDIGLTRVNEKRGTVWKLKG